MMGMVILKALLDMVYLLPRGTSSAERDVDEEIRSQDHDDIVPTSQNSSYRPGAGWRRFCLLNYLCIEMKEIP
jgi:hypothetical protein